MTPEVERGVIDAAEVAAVYFREIVRLGVGRAEAVQLTSSYVSMLVVVSNQNAQSAVRPTKLSGLAS